MLKKVLRVSVLIDVGRSGWSKGTMVVGSV